VSGAPDIVAVYLRWIWWRAVLHNGWWLVTSIYLVVEAGLSPSQLVLIGVAQGVVALVFEIPAGVVADTISRKWALVVSHLLMGTAMLATGLVTDFGPLVATQMLWGLAWTFASGADVAWVTDELDEPARISGVLVRSARAQLTGAAAGLVSVGALGSLLQRSTAMVLAGAAMLLLGLYVVVRFREERFVRAPARRWSASWPIFVRGAALVRRSRAILVMFAATFLVNGAWVAFGRMHPRRLVDIGLPSDPVAWYTALGVLTLLVGAAVLLVAGIAMPLTRTLATIWVNRQTSADVRATVHSFLAQAEYVGEIACGLAIAVIARLAGLSPALLTCAALFAITIVLIRRPSATRSAPRRHRGISGMTSAAKRATRSSSPHSW
jgi:MFS family permease